MLNFFNFKKKSFVGIDFGTSAIKIVELSYRDQKTQLINYGWVDLEVAAGNESREQRLLSVDEKLKVHLANLLKKLKIKTDAAYVSMPAFVGLFVLLELPEMGQDDLEKAVQFEARKYIPNSLNEVSLGWEIVKKGDVARIITEKGATRKMQVLMVAAPKKEVDRYESIVKSVGIGIKALELETFSLVRSLVGDDMGTFLIVDIGARVTNLILVEKSVIKVNRSLSIGGNEITSALAESLNISRPRAEIFKKENRDLFNDKETMVLIPPMEMIVNESLRIAASYLEKTGGGRIASIILSGGSAKIKGLDEYFSRITGIPTILGKPWRKISFDKRLSFAIENIGTSYSVALGLALRGIEEYRRR